MIPPSPPARRDNKNAGCECICLCIAPGMSGFPKVRNKLGERPRNVEIRGQVLAHFGVYCQVLLYKNRLRRDGRAPWSRRGRAVRAARVFYTAPFCWGGWPGRLELVGMVRAAGVPIRRGSPPDAVPRPVRQGPLKKPGLLKKGQRLPLVVIGRL